MEVEEQGADKTAAAAANGGLGGGESERTEEEKKLWNTVNANPSDFKSWTSLLQLAEKHAVLDIARETFSRFFELYPFCYGYWKKYSELIRKLSGDAAAKEILDQGVTAIPLSIDLWLHYISFATSFYRDSPTAEQEIRSLYDRAIQGCGMDYKSTKLWESYISWESAGGRQKRVTAVYDKLLAIPTKELATHFENFKKLLENTPSAQMLSDEEFQEIASQAGEVTQGEAMLDSYARKITLERRTAAYERAMAELERRKHFETMIKRPYFHVKPLERLQLKNWREYLDFEISQGDPRRIKFLFERCIVSCALYEDFWSKYCKYAETYVSDDEASEIYRRACTIHLQQKPNIHISWAAFEEGKGNVDRAREILSTIDRAMPSHEVDVRMRRISLEIRQGCYANADTLYQETLSSTIALETRNFYTWRYSRFLYKLMQDHNKAVSIMNSAVSMDPSNSTLHLQLLDLHTSGHTPPDWPAAEALFSKVENSTHLSEETKENFLIRRKQLLEEFGGSLIDLSDVTEKLDKSKKQARKRAASESEGGPAKKAQVEQHVTTPTSGPGGVALTPEQQQWAAYQQQWTGYNYAQPQQGYNYQAYYPPYSYAQQQPPQSAPATT